MGVGKSNQGWIMGSVEVHLTDMENTELGAIFWGVGMGAWGGMCGGINSVLNILNLR